MEPMELNPLDELEVLRAEVQDLLQAELARGVAMAPRPERAEFEPAAGAPAAGPAAARPERSQPATRPAPRPSSRSGSPARSEPKAVVASKAKAAPARSGKSKWGGSPSSPKRPDPPPAPPQAAPPNMGMEGPPPPEAPDWIVEEEASGPPPDLGIPLPPPPKVYKRPKKREIAYTYNHVSVPGASESDPSRPWRLAVLPALQPISSWHLARSSGSASAVGSVSAPPTSSTAWEKIGRAHV